MVLAHAAAVESKRKEMLHVPRPHDPRRRALLCGQYKEYFGIGGPGLIDEGLVFGHSGLRQHVLSDHQLPRLSRARPASST